jgi:2'-5' RNA ligase
MASCETEIYEKLWKQAHAEFSQGRQQVDAHLSKKAHDLRRGVTIVARPSSAVCGKVNEFLSRLSAMCPEQYYYSPEELHVTVLSVISTTAAWRNEIRSLATYRSIVRNVLRRHRSFMLRFDGITASPNAVMIQGFQIDDGLQQIREDLRAAFATRGFGDVIERRYESRTAHLTALRFSRPVADLKNLVPLLEQARQFEFGETKVTDLQLIWGDWYASKETVRVLERYQLA